MDRLWRHPHWRDIALFESVEAGRVLEMFLRDNGVEARTYDDKWFRYFLFLRPPTVIHHVQVRKHHELEAAKLLEKYQPAVLAKAMHCPACGSLRLNYPQMTRRFVLPTILLHVGIILRIIDHECYCEHCHHVWYLSSEMPHPGPERKPFPFNY